MGINFELTGDEKTFLDYFTNEYGRLEIGPAIEWVYSQKLIPINMIPLQVVREEGYRGFSRDQHLMLISENFAENWDRPFVIPWKSREEVIQRIREADAYLNFIDRHVYSGGVLSNG